MFLASLHASPRIAPVFKSPPETVPQISGRGDCAGEQV